MSMSLTVSAAYLEDLPASSKLVLMALADSADDDGNGSIPGLGKIRAWSGLGKSRALEVLGELIDAGWVERTAAGRRGARAVYRVFPHGVPIIPTAAEVEARYASGAPDPVDSPQPHPQVGTTDETVHSPDPNGSGTADPNGEVRVRSDPLQGPTGRTPSLQPFGQDGARGRVRTAPTVDSRQRAGSAGSAPPTAVKSNNGPAERPVEEVLADTRRTKPADAKARAAEARRKLAKLRADRAAAATTTEEPSS